MLLDPSAQRGGIVGNGIGVQHPADPGLLPDEPVGLVRRDRTGAVGLVGSQERVGQHVVDPGRQGRDPCRIGPPPVGSPHHRGVGPPDQAHRAFHLADGAEGGGRDIGRGTREATQGILPVPRVVRHPRHHLGVGSLDQQGPDAAHEGCYITDQGPRHGAGTAHPGIAGILQGVGERVFSMAEGAGGRGPYPLPEGFPCPSHRPDPLSGASDPGWSGGCARPCRGEPRCGLAHG